jgi:CRP-like cAMP-binding protein
MPDQFDSFNAGDVVFARVAPGSVMYAVKSGEVELQVEGTA